MREGLLEPRYNLSHRPHVLFRQEAVRFIAKPHFDSATHASVDSVGGRSRWSGGSNSPGDVEDASAGTAREGWSS
jgi:hypothetical protein